MWFNKHDPRAMYADRRREYWKMTHPSGTRTANIDPDVIADFTALPFPESTFALVVFDPPHIPQETCTGMVVRQYGHLAGDWREMLRRGFAECFRVLRPEGTLIFKWNECRVPVKEILALTDVQPLFGHKSGKFMQTHWVAFLKPNVCMSHGGHKRRTNLHDGNAPAVVLHAVVRGASTTQKYAL
jgi:SAM-dependent methyltransferase